MQHIYMIDLKTNNGSQFRNFIIASVLSITHFQPTFPVVQIYIAVQYRVHMFS